MTVSYKSIARINPADSTAPPKYYATVVKKGVTDLNQLALLLGDGSTTRKADVYAVLVGLVEEIKKELTQGRMVKLGDLGSFTVGVHSEGVDSPNLVTSSLIKRRKIVYRSSSELKTMLATLKFKHV